eukprot:6555694-Alexandrium_andersonii.AAC.1
MAAPRQRTARAIVAYSPSGQGRTNTAAHSGPLTAASKAGTHDMRERSSRATSGATKRHPR